MTWLTSKLLGCAYAGCQTPPLDDHCMCQRHRDEHRRRNKKHMRARRAMALVQLGLQW